MTTTKRKALELIDQKIAQFNDVLKKANYENRYNEDYERAYKGTETLITQLFSSEKAKEFKLVTSSLYAGGLPPVRELRGYREHLRSCIAQLELYKKQIADFWEEDVSKQKEN